MHDDQLNDAPESVRAPRRRRGVSALLWGCLAIFVILIVVTAVAIMFTVLNLGDGVEQGGLADDVATTTEDQITPESAERPTLETLAAATELEEPTVEASATQALDEPIEQSSPEHGESTVAPTATPTDQPTATPTSEPTDTPTVEFTSTPAAEDDGPVVVSSGRIAVIDGEARLWTVSADGSDRRLLSERGRFYQFPSWSPAGNDIAVIGNDANGGGVFVVTDEEDSAMRQLYSDPIMQPIYLYWSPQGENVSFIARDPDGLALHVAPRDGSAAPQLVTTSPSTFFWDWMPDGSQVLVHTGFTARDSDNSRLAFVPLDSASEPEEIIQQGYFQAPAVAADGRYFSFSDVGPAGNRWLSVHDIERDQQVELVFHRGVVAMGFSLTRPQLAYISPERQENSFYGPLRMIDLESGDTRQLVAERVLAFFWSPDGRSIAYLTLATLEKPFEFDDAPAARLPGGPLVDLMVHMPATPRPKALAKAQSQDDEEIRIGLGLSIVDVDSGETRLLTVFEPSAVFVNQFLPFFDQYGLSHRLWSPDSTALVLPMEDEEERNFIVVVPADGSEPVPIARGVAAFWSQH